MIQKLSHRALRHLQYWCRGLCVAALAWLATGAMALACDNLRDISAMPETVSHIRISSTQDQEQAGILFGGGFDAPTRRYPHGVLGDTVEAGALIANIGFDDGRCNTVLLNLPQTDVFEDTQPRLYDLNRDGSLDIITVQSSATQGARLVVYGATPDRTGLMLYAATPPIGRPNRWLAPIGVADFDGDGFIEIAYIDRPHLARTLRVWRVTPDASGQIALSEIAHLSGLTNHRIGQDFITGGVRYCGGTQEMITADADWSHVMATRLGTDGVLTSRPLAPFSPSAVARALGCGF